MEEIIIKAWESDEGVMFSIYEGDDKYMECEESDGGLCTTTMGNALDMAVEQAKELIQQRTKQAAN